MSRPALADMHTTPSKVEASFGRPMLLLSVVGLAMTLSTVSFAQAPLSAEVIRQSFAGNTGEIDSPSGTIFVYWDANGSQRMRHPKGGPDKGAWRVTPEGDFCGKWTKLRNGEEVCAPVLDLGGASYQ